ncbi:UNVERIFIED_ORG: hypothetical protein J2W65_002210 [Pseudomonas parafulva]|jgi:hypothetical protein|uniref:hypothetical protein n=1 Tax=Pseudomonas TaxID=286 RepID=UPI00048110E7|nr:MULTISPECIES: hypothetical protein [Pseudomonas]MCY4125189.1 hypothetical protein [Pseudomonas sp.]MDP9556574.1 hypothetical protein [Pseudomonas parafulva]MDP9664512.1 hypothetical protein [Pseudomonas cremoricolorata]AVF56811.1 hypothetical protein AL527_17415 [Pseudomonas fulva]MBA1207208.1 hypothetical protein [Pseudomonas fulva]
MNDIYLKKTKGKLYLLEDGERYAIIVNHLNELQVAGSLDTPECFDIGMLAHPSLEGGVAFEFRTSAGKQVTGRGGRVLHASGEELGTPGPALQISHLAGNVDGEPNVNQVQLQTLDARYVSAHDRVLVGYKEVPVGWTWFGLTPNATKKVPVWESQPSDRLRYHTKDVAPAATFILEFVAPAEG